MKKIFSILFFILSYNYSYAQVINIDWGETYRSKGSGQVDILEVNEDGYSVIVGLNNFGKLARSKAKILRFDNNNNVTSEQKIEFLTRNKPTRLQEIIRTKDQLFCISNRPVQQFEIYATSYKDGSFGETKPVFAHEYIHNLKRPFSGNREVLDIKNKFSISQNKTAIVYGSEIYKYDRNKDEEIVIAVFNDQMELQWEKKLTIDYNDLEFAIKKIAVDDKGEQVIILGYLELDGVKFYRTFLLTQNSFREYSIKLKNKYFPISVTPFFDNINNKIILSGFYKTKPKRGRHGIFFLNVNKKEFSSSKIEYSPYPPEQEGLLGGMYSISEFRILDNGDYQFLATCKYCSISNSKGEYFRKVNDNITPSDIVGDCRLNSIFYFVTTPSGYIIRKNIISRNISTFFDKEGYKFFKNGEYSYLIYESELKKSDKKKFKLKGHRNNYIIKGMKINSEGAIISTKILIQSKKTKFLPNDIITSVYNDKLIIGGRKMRVNSQSIFDKPKFIFGSFDLKDLD